MMNLALLQAALQAAVPLWVEQLRRRPLDEVLAGVSLDTEHVTWKRLYGSS